MERDVAPGAKKSFTKSIEGLPPYFYQIDYSTFGHYRKTMKTLLCLFSISLIGCTIYAQTFSWSGYTAGSTSYSTGALTVNVSATSPGFQNSAPKYYAGSTVGSGQCGIAGGLALEQLFGNITTAQVSLLMDFTTGGTTTGTCSSISFQIKDINADESVQTFADWVEITALDGNNAAIAVASITATGGSNKVITTSGNTRIIKGYSNSSYGSRSSTTCDNVTITVTPPVGVPVKSITLKYHPDYTVSPNNYYNFTSPLRPAYQYISISSITATPTGSCVVLPVELAQFSADRLENRVQLNWLTETERNNDFFIIERSFDGSHFDSIGQVGGQGTKQSSTAYAFDDINTAPFTSYYRLKQVDFNGRPTYHDLVEVGPYLTEKLLQRVSPNPSNSNVICTVLSPCYQLLIVEISDLNGKLMLHSEYQIEKGVHQPIIDLSPFAKGVYRLTVRSELGETDSQLIVKTD